MPPDPQAIATDDVRLSAAAAGRQHPLAGTASHPGNDVAARDTNMGTGMETGMETGMALAPFTSG
ncbi:MAG: hypothetical protein WCG92_02455 [Hyphomicrobiales bacterium]